MEHGRQGGRRIPAQSSPGVLTAPVIGTYDQDLAGNNPETIVACINVGQGDCTVAADLRTGQALIIDCPSWGEQAVRALLRKLKIDRVEAMFVTHFDVDHFSGIPALAREYGPLVLYSNPETLLPEGNYFPKYRAALRAFTELQDLGLVDNRTANWRMNGHIGGICWTVLAPERSDVIRAMSTSPPDRNQASLVVRLDTGPAATLVGGDAPARVWRKIIERIPAPLVSAEVFRSSHHGAAFDSADTYSELLASIGPQHVVHSVGATNRYAHPAVSQLHPQSNAQGQPTRVLCTNVTPLCLGAMSKQERNAAAAGLGKAAPPPQAFCADTVSVETAGSRWRVLPSPEEHQVRIDLWTTPHCRSHGRLDTP